tara:strand:+ start:3624 stop:3938 length:315 start_codon:yes stop_codon:yes gene_type:complete
MNYQEIFEQKKEFLIRHDTGVTRFCYQENQDKGEFVDQDNNVIAQLYEVDKSKEWFVVAGMFMGEVILKTIPYYRLVSRKSARLIKTAKYTPENWVDDPKLNEN